MHRATNGKLNPALGPIVLFEERQERCRFLRAVDAFFSALEAFATLGVSAPVWVSPASSRANREPIDRRIAFLLTFSRFGVLGEV